MMLSSGENQLKKRLDSVNIDMSLYDALPNDIVNFIDNCINLGIPNESKCKYHPGDVVVKKQTSTNQVVADSYGIVRRWRVVACPFGIVVGQMLLGHNKLGSIEVLNHPAKTWSYIEMDPSYVNSLILQDGSFDPCEELNSSIKKRRSAAKYNKSISVRIKDIEHSYKFAMSLSPGDKLWVARTPLELTVSPAVNGFSVVGIDPFNDEIFTGSNDRNRYALTSVLVQAWNHAGILHMRLPSLIGHYVTTQEPFEISNIKLK
jgi:hypothetical protein